MAEAFLKSLDANLSVVSAGIQPARQVHPKAIQVMSEIGFDLSRNTTKPVDRFLDQPFDYVITVCDQARETCPVFLGEVKQQLHIGFDDPAEATGNDEEILRVFRRVRDEIKSRLVDFYTIYLRKTNLEEKELKC